MLSADPVAVDVSTDVKWVGQGPDRKLTISHADDRLNKLYGWPASTRRLLVETLYEFLDDPKNTRHLDLDDVRDLTEMQALFALRMLKDLGKFVWGEPNRGAKPRIRKSGGEVARKKQFIFDQMPRHWMPGSVPMNGFSKRVSDRRKHLKDAWNNDGFFLPTRTVVKWFLYAIYRQSRIKNAAKHMRQALQLLDGARWNLATKPLVLPGTDVPFSYAHLAITLQYYGVGKPARKGGRYGYRVSWPRLHEVQTMALKGPLRLSDMRWLDHHIQDQEE